MIQPKPKISELSAILDPPEMNNRRLEPSDVISDQERSCTIIQQSQGPPLPTELECCIRSAADISTEGCSEVTALLSPPKTIRSSLEPSDLISDQQRSSAVVQQSQDPPLLTEPGFFVASAVEITIKECSELIYPPEISRKRLEPADVDSGQEDSSANLQQSRNPPHFADSGLSITCAVDISTEECSKLSAVLYPRKVSQTMLEPSEVISGQEGSSAILQHIQDPPLRAESGSFIASDVEISTNEGINIICTPDAENLHNEGTD
ncbi:uncharacterized protein LOC131681230 [Topomyia yanbarensis]|uniref:uncharacterized protein LOC131681230 n=1 Tax=Topomyia yanbarensis TaxID=2498891 RepID=UPI00273CDA80|nr:uncharacterized protein LOC131681230 [Topomyia yanbarensis]